MNKEILKLAESLARFFPQQGDNGTFDFTPDEVIAFYRAAFNAGIEAAESELDDLFCYPRKTDDADELGSQLRTAIRRLKK